MNRLRRAPARARHGPVAVNPSSATTTIAAHTLPAAVDGALRAAARTLGASGGGPGAARLLQLLYDPDVEIERVLACLNGEPALATRVLKVANSAYYRQAGQVTTLARALQVMGLAAIRGVAAAGCLDRLGGQPLGRAFDPVRFRHHSLMVAVAAQRLCKDAGNGLADEAFMAGLLHDIGILLLAHAAPQAMASFDPEGADTAREQQHFGSTHEASAALLVQAWSLPAALGAAAAGHHDDMHDPAPAGGAPALAACLRVADHLACLAGHGLWSRCDPAPSAAVLATLGMDAAALPALAAELPAACAALGGSA